MLVGGWWWWCGLFSFVRRAYLYLILYCVFNLSFYLFLDFLFFLFFILQSYEFMRSDKIDYLQGTKDFDLPYSRGLCKNLNIFCCNDGFIYYLRELIGIASDWKPTAWDVPNSIIRNGEISDNCWENKHYRCC